MYRTSIGDLTISIHDEAQVLRPLCRELEAKEVGGEDGATPGIEIRSCTALRPTAPLARRDAGVLVGEGVLVARTRQFVYQLESEGSIYRLAVGMTPSSRSQWIPERLYRLKSADFASENEHACKNLLYMCLDYLTQLAQLPLGQSFVHASAVERGGHAVALCGWGNVGKTSSLLQLLSGDSGWKYIADDLAIISKDGRITRHPKFMTLYPYNFVGDETRWKDLAARRPLLDRLSWSARARLSGKRSVRRRMPARAVVGPERVSDGARLGQLILLDRGGADWVWGSAESDSVVRALSHTLVRELSPLTDVAAASNSIMGRSVLPAIPEILKSTGYVLGQALSGVDLHTLMVPEDAGPRELGREVQRHLDASGI